MSAATPIPAPSAASPSLAALKASVAAALPELVAILHSFVGLAAVLVGFSSYLEPMSAGATEVKHTEVEHIVHLLEVWVGVAVGAFGLLITASPWRRERIFAYLNPWEESNALGKAYQLTHSLIAFGRGEWTGVGLGGSIEAGGLPLIERWAGPRADGAVAVWVNEAARDRDGLAAGRLGRGEAGALAAAGLAVDEHGAIDRHGIPWFGGGQGVSPARSPNAAALTSIMCVFLYV